MRGDGWGLYLRFRSRKPPLEKGIQLESQEIVRHGEKNVPETCEAFRWEALLPESPGGLGYRSPEG